VANLKCKRFLELLRICLAPRKKLFAATLAAALVFSLLEFIIPKVLQLYVDAVAGNDLRWFGMSVDFLGTTRGKFIGLPVILLSFAALRWYFTYMRSVLQTKLGQAALFDLRSRIFNTMQNLSFAYHDSSHSGTLISNVVEDVAQVAKFFQMGLFPSIESFVYIVLGFVIMFVICPAAALASLAFYLLSLPAVYFFFKYGTRLFARTKQLFAETVQLFSENMEGHNVVKAFGCHREQAKLHNDRADTLHQAAFREVAAGFCVYQALVWCAVAGVAITVAVALHEAQRGAWAFTAGNLFMLFFIQRMIVTRSRMLSPGLENSMRFLVTAERLSKLFESSERLPDKGTRILPHDGAGSVEFRNIAFSYTGQDRSLDNIQMKIAAGETIGLVGATGSGKSTLALLMCRFHDPTSGTVLLDDCDIQDFPLKDVRDQFSLVFQDSFLFSTTIRDNIAYGRHGAKFEDIVHAATVAQAHDFIMECPEGYETHVGERGATLSGGQRQRLSIARAVLRRPRFLILDACTSAVDPITEKAIQDGLSELHTTAIIIAQRYSSVAHADRVFVLEEGQIVETGTPYELNKPGSLFNRLLNASPDGGPTA
jgi:ABC-type multidrug transport system fused ATPase/permease subunit